MQTIGVANIVHPCDHYARGAGFPSWRVALDAIKAGAVIAAHLPAAGKSTLNLQLFMAQVETDGLMMVALPSDILGRIFVGFPNNFPKDALEEIEQERKQFERRFAHLLGVPTIHVCENSDDDAI